MKKSKYILHELNITEFWTKGYMVIAISPYLLGLIKNIQEKGRFFFSLSKELKMANSIPIIKEGYREFGTEFSITPKRPDLHESFWVTQKSENLVKQHYSGEGMELYSVMSECISAYNEIENCITINLMEYFNKGDVSEYRIRCDRDSDMQLLFYEPYKHRRTLLQDQHDDGLYLTFVKANNPGLEILTAEKSFLPIQLQENEILIMPGEIMSLLTGGIIKPLIHRVKNHKKQVERISLGYFLLPNLDKDQVILPWVEAPCNLNINIMHTAIINQNQFIV